MNKLETLAVRLGGTVVPTASTEACTTHGVSLATQELITPAKSKHVRTICPFAGRDECDNQESVTHVI